LNLLTKQKKLKEYWYYLSGAQYIRNFIQTQNWHCSAIFSPRDVDGIGYTQVNFTSKRSRWLPELQCVCHGVMKYR